MHTTHALGLCTLGSLGGGGWVAQLHCSGHCSGFGVGNAAASFIVFSCFRVLMRTTLVILVTVVEAGHLYCERFPMKIRRIPKACCKIHVFFCVFFYYLVLAQWPENNRTIDSGDETDLGHEEDQSKTDNVKSINTSSQATFLNYSSLTHFRFS